MIATQGEPKERDFPSHKAKPPAGLQPLTPLEELLVVSKALKIMSDLLRIAIIVCICCLWLRMRRSSRYHDYPFIRGPEDP